MTSRQLSPYRVLDQQRSTLNMRIDAYTKPPALMVLHPGGCRSFLSACSTDTIDVLPCRPEEL